MLDSAVLALVELDAFGTVLAAVHALVDPHAPATVLAAVAVHPVLPFAFASVSSKSSQRSDSI